MKRPPGLRRMAPMLLFAAVLGACSQPGSVDGEVTASPAASPDTTADTTPTDEPGASESEPVSTCANTEEGYELTFPADWHVNEPGTTGPCRVFDPQPFTVEPQTEIPAGLAVVVKMEQVAMERMLEGDQEGEVLRREELSVAGREAVVLELRAGDDAPLQEPGTLSYLYLVRIGPERTFVARTTDRGDTPYPDKQRVLDEMVSTLKFFGPSA